MIFYITCTIYNFLALRFYYLTMHTCILKYKIENKSLKYETMKKK